VLCGEATCMLTKTYRPYHPHQLLLLPPSLQDWLPENHLAYFVSDLVDSFDLSAIEAEYEDQPRGAPPYHPAMMVKVLLYAYCTGVFSSRKIARRLIEDLGFRVLAAGNTPDFRTLSEFRRRHLQALGGLFHQVLRLAQQAGMVKLGYVALDGTKIRANASKHKAMSYQRLTQEEARLAEQVRQLLERAEATDAAEDAQYGADRSGDELPEELQRRETRLQRIRQAKAALEEQARRRAAEQAQQAAPPPAQPNRPRRGRPRRNPAQAQPPARAQYNFTDPDSRIMLDPSGAFVQAYNAQVAVEGSHQIIVAAEVSPQAADAPHLAPMVQQVVRLTGARPRRLLADAGYFSEANLRTLTAQGIDPLIPPDKLRHTHPLPPAPRGRIPKTLSLRDRMRRKLRTRLGRTYYNLRKSTVEPVLGQIKAALGFRQFSFRSLTKVRAEWLLVACAHNLRKLYTARHRLLPAPT